MNTEQPKKNNVPRFNLTWIYVIVGGVLIYLLLFGDNRTSASKDTNLKNTVMEHLKEQGYEFHEFQDLCQQWLCRPYCGEQN